MTFALSSPPCPQPATPVRATAAEGTPATRSSCQHRFSPMLPACKATRGARDLFQTHPAVACPLPGDRALTDLDQPDGWDRWLTLHS